MAAMSQLYPRFLAEEAAEGEVGEEESHIMPRTAVLFPWFFELVGVLVFYLLTRYLRPFPYTAAMFLLGMCAGIGVNSADTDNLLHDSIRQWTAINGELLLNVFLPGLIFKDAVSLNFHLFTESISQLLILAFPAVLGGATLTALVAFYIFPYGWSFSLAMTFGAILAATDPVAVSALLNEVGAPPRLKMHISGESLLNDGSAIVFYVIFSQRYLFELGIEGFGDDVNVREGFALFFREALGGAALGIAFGLGLVVLLYFLDRRFEEEENIVQVAASITTAYLCFYSADINKMSGVMAVVLCGITTKAFGASMINDVKLWDNFWSLTEHLLNSLLFGLGGTVWGTIIAPSDFRAEDFGGKDWGYLIVLYLLLNVIRFILLFGFYPITSRIGLKGDLRESFFSAFGGLRGAIGIALALSLDSEVREYTEIYDTSKESREETNKLFGFVGGIALLTLVVNGSLAGPLLRKLGLADSTGDRKRVVDRVHLVGLRDLYVHFIQLLTEDRFRDVDFASVKDHITGFKNFTLEDLKVALRMHKDSTPPKDYQAPYLDKLLPYLLSDDRKPGDLDFLEEFRREATPCKPVQKPESSELTSCDTTRLLELRQAFITLLQATYEKHVTDGELDGRVGFVALSLDQGLEFASDRVAKGEPLQDWKFSVMLSSRLEQGVVATLDKIAAKFSRKKKKDVHVSVQHVQLRLEIHRALAFIKAHLVVQEIFKKELCESEEEFSTAEKLVLYESQVQVQEAEAILASMNQVDVDAEVSHLFSIIMLNKVASYIKDLLESGILTQREAGQYNEEIEEELDILLRYCPNSYHPGQLSAEERAKIFPVEVEEEAQANS